MMIHLTEEECEALHTIIEIALIEAEKRSDWGQSYSSDVARFCHELKNKLSDYDVEIDKIIAQQLMACADALWCWEI